MDEVTLSEFIGEALSQILLGVDDAKKKLEDTNREDWVSPPIVSIGRGEESLNQTVRALLPNGNSGDAHLVWFDIAVSAAEGTEKGARLKVLSSLLGAEAGGKKTSDFGSVSRIRFSIPLFLAGPTTSPRTRQTQAISE